jgi:hypothetical protein
VLTAICATAIYQLFIRQLPVSSHNCPCFFATRKQIVYDLESCVPVAECKKDLTALSSFETYAPFPFMSTQVPVLRAHCGLHTAVL